MNPRRRRFSDRVVARGERRSWRAVVVAAGLGVTASALLGWRDVQLPPSFFSHPVGEVRTATLLFEFPIEAFSPAWFVVVLPPIACVVAALVATTAWFAHAHAPRPASATIFRAAVVLCIACVGVFGVVITDNASYRPSAGYWLAAVSTCALASAIITTRRSHKR